MITCKRVCFNCLSYDWRYRPLRQSHAAMSYGIKRSTFKSLPHMKSIPGVYSPNQRNFRVSIMLIDNYSAYCAGVSRHGSPSLMEQFVSSKRAQRVQRYEARVVRRDLTAPAHAPMRRRQPLAPQDMYDGNPLRFMAIVRTPWLNTASNSSVQGAHCKGCHSYFPSERNWRREFDPQTFAEHIESCGEVIRGRHARPK